jgi:hypothetical protein
MQVAQNVAHLSNHTKPHVSFSPKRRERFESLDRELRELASVESRSRLEVSFGLLEAEQIGLADVSGYGSVYDYAEHVLGYARRKTVESLRIARQLRQLPMLRRQLERGEQYWSVAKELTRVANSETEREWLEAVVGCTVRDVEKMVKGLGLGARPGDRPDPGESRQTFRFEFNAEEEAVFREAVARVQKDSDEKLSETEAVVEVMRRSMSPVTVGTEDTQKPSDGQAPYQLAITICQHCARGFQEGGGELIEVPPEVVEMACCDAKHIGHLHASDEVCSEGSSTPTHVGSCRKQHRASQTVPPRIRRQTLHRAHRQCEVPGCTNKVGLHVHHSWLRQEGGDHNPKRLAVVCPRHHKRLHQGMLLMEGDADSGWTFLHADGTPYGQGTDPRTMSVYAEAFSKLVDMGYGETESKQALRWVREGLEGKPSEPLTVVRMALSGLKQAA